MKNKQLIMLPQESILLSRKLPGSVNADIFKNNVSCSVIGFYRSLQFLIYTWAYTNIDTFLPILKIKVPRPVLIPYLEGANIFLPCILVVFLVILIIAIPELSRYSS